MDPRVRVLAAVAQLDRANYYDLLRVQRGGAVETLQEAWHRFALAYHPDCHCGEAPEIREAAKKVYQRGVEAYSVLRDQAASAAYDATLARGETRLPVSEFERLSRDVHRRQSLSPLPPSPKPALAEQSFADQMHTPEGREVAARIELLIGNQRYQDASTQLGLLETLEPDNPVAKLRGDKVAALLRRRAQR